jgi:hypothetical protein
MPANTYVKHTWQSIRICRLRIWPADTYSFGFVFVEYSFLLRLNELFETNMSTPVSLHRHIIALMNEKKTINAKVVLSFSKTMKSLFSRPFSEFYIQCANQWPACFRDNGPPLRVIVFRDNGPPLRVIVFPDNDPPLHPIVLQDNDLMGGIIV